MIYREHIHSILIQHLHSDVSITICAHHYHYYIYVVCANVLVNLASFFVVVCPDTNDVGPLVVIVHDSGALYLDHPHDSIMSIV